MKKIFKESVIDVKGVGYFRDLGGLMTKDGKQIKYGLIYRSSHLSKMNEAKQQVLSQKFGISKVIDFRSPSEIEARPEELIADIDYQLIQILDDNDNPAVTRKTRNKVLKNNMANPGGTKGHLQGVYRKLINLERANQEYNNFFKEIIACSGKPLVYHCTQGKDRTGVATILLLLALGVDKEIIIKDYLYYNKVNRRKNIGFSLGVLIAYFSYRKAKGLYYLLTANRAYAEAAFEEIEALGGIDNYLANYIKLTDDDISYLKNTYLK